MLECWSVTHRLHDEQERSQEASRLTETQLQILGRKQNKAITTETLTSGQEMVRRRRRRRRSVVSLTSYVLLMANL